MVAEDTAQVLEEAKDVVEDAAVLVESRISWMAKNPRTMLVLVGAGSFATGLVVGGLVAAKKLKLKYKAISDAEIADIKEHYSIPRIIEEKPNLDELAAQYEETETLIKDNKYHPYNELSEQAIEEKLAVQESIATAEGITDEEEAEEIRVETTRSIFDSVDPETYFDYDEELRKREENPNIPYVITKDEFDQNDPEFEQISLTYFDGDDILSDSRDQSVDDIENTVGHENLLRFGHGSQDRNVVYIRNERLTCDIEVLYSEGSYSREVLGVIEHSDKPGIRKFRTHD